MAPRRRTAEATAQRRAELIEHARQLIAREGGSALTMRALATEAGCALGLPYKLFTDRQELVAEVVGAEFDRLSAAREQLLARAGTATVAENLAWFAELLLDAPAVTLAREVLADDALSEAVAARAHETGRGPGSLEVTFAAYLAAEKEAGRVVVDADEDAFGFLIAGAVHNLVMSGPAYPRPTRDQLERHLAAVAERLESH